MLRLLDRQVAAFWARRFRGRRLPSPRIAVAGGCQAFGVAYGMRLLLPEAQVDHFTVDPGTITDIGMLGRVLDDYDFSFCSDFPKGFVRGGESADLFRVSKAKRYPLIAYGGFHPDFMYVHSGRYSTNNLTGPMGPYHSAVAVFAFVVGLPAGETERLYRRAVYERLGYFETWKRSTDYLLSHAKQTGIDLTQPYLRWSRKGCFMHTPNHPKAHVLFDLAGAMLAHVGLPVADLDFDQFALDPLASQMILPLYPEVAEEFGLRGSYLFRLPRAAGGGALTLREFIRRSYRAYDSVPKAALANARTDAMMADADLVRALRALAAGEAAAG